MNGVASTAMRNNGLNYKINFGLDAMAIRELAGRYTPNAGLAERLWSENARECKILGTLLYPKTEFTPEKADTWLEGCFVPELTEQLCFNLLQHLAFAPAKASEWIRQTAIEQKTAGYLLALRLILKKVSLPNSQELLCSAKTDSLSADYGLRQTASRFLERASAT
jgi:hypothetical protein